MWETLNPSLTLLPGVIKNAEGAIDGRRTYARILIRQTSVKEVQQ